MFVRKVSFLLATQTAHKCWDEVGCAECCWLGSTRSAVKPAGEAGPGTATGIGSGPYNFIIMRRRYL